MVSLIIAALKLARPINSLSASLGVLIGGYMNTREISNELWLAALVAGLLTASGNMINDYCDLETDRVNKPKRVLPSGKLKPTFALWLGIIVSILAVLISIPLGWILWSIAVSMACLSFLYSWRLKKTFLLGNAVVSLMTALTFYYGGLVSGQIGNAWVPALIVLLFMFAREILKTIEDLDGDYLVGAETIAVKWGKSKSIFIFAMLAIIVALLIPLPWLMHDVSIYYLLLAIPFVSLALLLVVLILLKRSSVEVVKKSLLITKGSWIIWAFAMGLGLIFQ